MGRARAAPASTRFGFRVLAPSKAIRTGAKSPARIDMPWGRALIAPASTSFGFRVWYPPANRTMAKSMPARREQGPPPSQVEGYQCPSGLTGLGRLGCGVRTPCTGPRGQHRVPPRPLLHLLRSRSEGSWSSDLTGYAEPGGGGSNPGVHHGAPRGRLRAYGISPPRPTGDKG